MIKPICCETVSLQATSLKDNVFFVNLSSSWQNSSTVSKYSVFVDYTSMVEFLLIFAYKYNANILLLPSLFLHYFRLTFETFSEITISYAQYGFQMSLLERLMQKASRYQRNDGKFNQHYITKLVNNYRSHEAILKVNFEFFNKMTHNYFVTFPRDGTFFFPKGWYVTKHAQVIVLRQEY